MTIAKRSELDKMFLVSMIDILNSNDETRKLFKATIYREDAPQTGKAVFEMYKNTLENNTPFVIFSGANEKSFFTSATNLIYRTLHDIHHAQYYAKGHGTTKLKDEAFLNTMLAYKCYKKCQELGYSTSHCLQLFYAIFNDTVQQSIYYSNTGEFVEDQESFTKNKLLKCKGYLFSCRNMLSLAEQEMIGTCNYYNVFNFI